jgi:hypothetical protein
MNNPNVTIKDLTEELAAPCQRQEVDHVLAIQDTCQYNFERRRGRFSKDDPDIGVLSDNSSLGLFVHPMLCVDADSGLPFGISSLSLYHLPTDRLLKNEKKYKRLPITEKHSYRWIKSIKESAVNLTKAKKVTVLADRESDMYELFATNFDPRVELLVRSAQNRKLANGQLLHDFLDSQPWLGSYDQKIKGNKKRLDRTATLQIRWASVEIVQPKNIKEGVGEYPDKITMQVVEVREANDQPLKEGEEPIHWYLYTTHPVETLEQALQVVEWYTNRWWIEDFFRLTKNKGFKLEDSQFSNGLALQRLICLVFGEAIRVLSLRQGRKTTKPETATLLFDPAEINLLRALLPQLQGKTSSQSNLNPELSMAWAVWIIARLGGWTPRNIDIRPPGVVTLIRGLRNFNQQAEGFRLAMTIQNALNP